MRSAFTNVKDKHGREIKQGDIVLAPGMYEGAVCVVVWSDEYDCWVIKNERGGLTGLVNRGGKFQPEIIGNVQDDSETFPELVKQYV